MTVTESIQDRVAAAARWQAAKEAAASYAAGNADLRRDQRVEEAQASDAARPRPKDRSAATPERSRPTSTAKLFDVVA